jgi:hypothetical protein
MAEDYARVVGGVCGLANLVSKAPVNILTVQYARALPKRRINAVGFTATYLNMFQGMQTVEQGAKIMVRMAARRADRQLLRRLVAYPVFSG